MGLSTLLLGLHFSPASQDVFQPPHKGSFSSQEIPSVLKELNDHLLSRKTINNLQKLRQVEKRKRGCSPDITLLIQCITHVENLLLCGKVPSYHLVIIVSWGFETAQEGERGF